MFNKKSFSVIVFMGLILVTMFSSVAVAVPSITVSPDNIFNPNETEYVNGTGFQPNSTVRIDLVYSSSTTAEGVTYSTTDANGTFSANFKAPDFYGTGYVKAVCGGEIVSTYVVYEGTASFSLDVECPDDIYTNKSTEFRVTEQSLNDKNYIIDVQTISPKNVESWSYHVLHNGLCNIPIEFQYIGEYYMNISIEGTWFEWSDFVEVEYYSPSSSGSGGLTGNVTWDVTQVDSSYIIMLFKEGQGYVQSGSLTVIKPDMGMNYINIISGSATLNVDEKGTYRVQYQDDGGLYIENIEYNPVIGLSASNFNDAGQCSITMTVDGNTPDESVTVTVKSTDSDNQITLVNGVGTFSTTIADTYTFSVNYHGATASTSVRYSDEYVVQDFNVYQSQDTTSLVISGEVVGKKSGEGLSNARVSISCQELNYDTTVKTSSSGSFRVTVPLSGEDKGGWLGGNVVTVSYEYGDFDDDQTVKLSSDFWGETWWLWTIIIVILLYYLWDSGRIYDWTGHFPPRNEKTMGSGGDFSDDDFS